MKHKKMNKKFKSSLNGAGDIPQEIKSNKNFKENLEVKNAVGVGFFEPFSWGGWGNMSSYLALQYYRQVSSLAIGVDKISDNVSSIAPIIWNKKEKKIVDEDSRKPSLGILKLLEYPNADVAFGELIKRWVNFYKITGNAFLMATGDVMKPPLELFVPPSQNITLIPGKDGFTEKIMLNTGSFSEEFHRTWVKGRTKFYNKSKTAEIYHTRTFNPYIGGGVQNYGVSELCAIYYEIEQHIFSSIHNLSLLKKGGRLSGALINNGEPLSDDGFSKMQNQINAEYSGASNAGRIMLLESGGGSGIGSGLSYVEMGLSNKDMDFSELSRRTEQSIFKRLKIPLALIDTSSMTYDNLSTSLLAFYHDAVLPEAQHMYQEMTDFLMHRYPDSSEDIITFDIDNVEALKYRRLQQSKLKNDTGCYTINEIRAENGDPPIDGGDSIYRPMNLYPVAENKTPSHVDPANIFAEEYVNSTDDENLDDDLSVENEENYLTDDSNELSSESNEKHGYNSNIFKLKKEYIRKMRIKYPRYTKKQLYVMASSLTRLVRERNYEL